MLTNSPRVPGLDGRKMSKSFDNAIYISDPEDVVRKKMMSAITDPARQKRTDAGNPDVCNIYAYHKLYTDEAVIKDIDGKCRSAAIGCVDCKKMCIENALKFWAPIRERRSKFEGKDEELMKIAREGSAKARAEALKMMDKVRTALHLNYGK